MSDSDSSGLSSAPPTDDEIEEYVKPVGLARYFKPATKANYQPKVVVPACSPPPPKREPSPPHEFKLIDNDAIAVLVMFRSRFADAINKSCPHFGPEELEAGIRDIVPTELAERLLCSLLALCLNRKKDPEREHYGRALEEAVSTHANQWPRAWEGKNPLHGGGNFKTMGPEQRLVLLRTLVYWSLSSSTAIQTTIKESYKQARQEDDRNQPLSVQPWGRDGYKRRYWLVEGQDDTHFQVYRENSGVTAKTNVWFGVAGTIDEVNVLAVKLDEEGTPHARQLRDKIRAAVPRFEAGEEKRRRRDYRLARKAAFQRPEPGFSMYEGRTRGKRMKYTFSDDEEDYSDGLATRRSTRQSGISTPDVGPVVTASGRQVKARQTGVYGESLLIDQRKELDHNAMDLDELAEPSTTTSGRPQRSAARTNGWAEEGQDTVDKLDEESEAASDEHDWEAEDESDNEPDLGDDEEEDEPSEEELDEDEDEVGEDERDSLVVQLRYRGGSKPPDDDVKVVIEPQQPPIQPKPDSNGVDKDHHIKPESGIAPLSNGQTTTSKVGHETSTAAEAGAPVSNGITLPEDKSTEIPIEPTSSVKQENNHLPGQPQPVVTIGV